jgi:hypothetical protein
MRRRPRLLPLIALVGVAAIVPAVALAAGPKRGTYIDTKLQTYIVTTKDVSAVKSFQTQCTRASTGQAGGSFSISRKIRLNSKGGFSYTGKAKLFTSGDPVVDTVKVTATFSKGRFKGTAEWPKGYDCKIDSFSAKYYGVNPRG